MKNKILSVKTLFNEEDVEKKINTISKIMNLDYKKNFKCESSELLYWACNVLQDDDKGREIIEQYFFADSEKRYEEYIKPLMIEVPEGEFVMGSTNEEQVFYCGEKPAHLVKINSFLCSKYNVTEEMFSKFMNVKCRDENLPVTNVTWYDAKMFAQWVGCRLLSEAEWEYACKAKSKYPWTCTEDDLKNYAWYSENSNGNIHKVGELQSNRFGIYDMHGNVWEWCEDAYDDTFYEHSDKENPINKNKSDEKVCRGGSIHAFSDMCRNSFRYHEKGDFCAYDLGFRLAKNIKKKEEDSIF